MRLENEIIIESRKKILAVSIDGEVEAMKTPLHYKINCKNLKVIMPEESCSK